jgi:ATP-binding protein involved in chromosome partitioning
MAPLAVSLREKASLRHMTFRTYNEVSGDDQSGMVAQVVAHQQRVHERLTSVRCVVAVVSGKGGVGKSFVTASLARALSAHAGTTVGVLDADLKSPTVAKLLEARGPVRVDEGAVHPAIGAGGVRVFSTDLLLEEGRPLLWRGPTGDQHLWRTVLETGALRECLADVAWGALDVLLIDLPPDADRVIDLAELVPGRLNTIVVTIPSEESRRSVERLMHRLRDANVAMLGVIENMSGYQCAGCEATRPLFTGDAGTSLARQFGVQLLARVPFDPQRAPGSDGDAFATATRAVQEAFA